MKDIYQIIKKVRISEKATVLHETTGEIVFEVERDANKIEIKQAIERAFDKKVVSVRTANYDGKERRRRRSDAGRAPHWKKAYVRLADGQSLDLV
ncbi:50S ribosomal protein L23 [Akkermansia glycaniphila]|uniref:Large ribosomal subunit protein uL23 n=1 Tax=Akkermansia glycaniphila TaxID=1679444 RepID=A0A1C7PCJ9_9BACT|nr:50S ribosomal protein L23 [Akkermansia glycaniphila]MBT9448545.1 50S ribosomal protein L23 [Akkermansia glycaniphila]OCA03316.1 50S ribosomal protein L23 [Akkermansia glycaniphila]SEH80624.1 ribosomal protein l23 [Akkermansia glycaniphila]